MFIFVIEYIFIEYPTPIMNDYVTTRDDVIVHVTQRAEAMT